MWISDQAVPAPRALGMRRMAHVDDRREAGAQPLASRVPTANASTIRPVTDDEIVTALKAAHAQGMKPFSANNARTSSTETASRATSMPSSAGWASRAVASPSCPA